MSAKFKTVRSVEYVVADREGRCLGDKRSYASLRNALLAVEDWNKRPVAKRYGPFQVKCVLTSV